jgi:hypothetical protein
MNYNNIKNIGILCSGVPLFNHITYYQNLIDILSYSNITFFGDIWFKNNLKPIKRITFVNKKSELSNKDFYSSIVLQLNKLDAIIIDENIGNHLTFLKFIRKVKVKKYFTVHNINHWFNPKLKINTLHSLLIRKVILMKMDCFIVISPNLKTYLKNFTLKPVFFIPFLALNMKSRKKSKNNKTIFSIPGSYDKRKRDYKIVLKAFFEALKINPKIKLYLLGKFPDNFKYLSLINEINNVFPDSIKIWHDYILPKEYDKLLANSDFFIGNMKPNLIDENFNEIYGKSKETGVFFLAINYRKKTIIPKSYKLHHSLSVFFQFYSSKRELVNLFTSIKKPSLTEKDLIEYKEIVNVSKKHFLSSLLDA